MGVTLLSTDFGGTTGGGTGVGTGAAWGVGSGRTSLTGGAGAGVGSGMGSGAAFTSALVSTALGATSSSSWYFPFGGRADVAGSSISSRGRVTTAGLSAGVFASEDDAGKGEPLPAAALARAAARAAFSCCRFSRRACALAFLMALLVGGRGSALWEVGEYGARSRAENICTNLVGSSTGSSTTSLSSSSPDSMPRASQAVLDAKEGRVVCADGLLMVVERMRCARCHARSVKS